MATAVGGTHPTGMHSFWHNFCRRLHENEKNWTERGHTSLTPLDLPLIVTKCQIGPCLMSREFHKDSLNSLRVTVVRKLV